MLSRLRGRKLLACFVGLVLLAVISGALVLPRLGQITAASHGNTTATATNGTGQAQGPVQPWDGHVPSQIAKWSQPATWGGKVPGAGAAVTIPPGKTVLLDVSPPALRSLMIQGTLIAADMDLSLSADWIIVPSQGKFYIGAETEPFKHRFTLTLTGNNTQENIMSMGTKLLGVPGGTLELHGTKRVSWVRLGANVQAGSAQITLEKAVDWVVGDRIAISSTDYQPLQAEEATIKAISGTTVTLDHPLQYMHWGQIQAYGGINLDERAEVGLLSHSIVVKGDDNSVQNGFGGHTMFMGHSTIHIEGVEFYHMGQMGHLARYPLHWHLVGDAPGQYVKDSTVDHSFSRCVTIHGTNHLLVQSNVAFDNVGHCFFLEDGVEHDNILENNLGMLTRKPVEGTQLLTTDMRPATFWITNPNNILRGNVAGGSQALGFWFAMPLHPMNFSRNDNIWPRTTPLGVFSDNVTHSNDDTGLLVDNGASPDGTSEDSDYLPRQDPANDSAPVVANFKNLTAYKNRTLAIWLRGGYLEVTGAKIADNGGGTIFAAHETFLKDSLMVGESDNKGTPGPDEGHGVDGRSLPVPYDPSTPIVGYSFYDGRDGAQNVTFANFQSNNQRPAGALSYIRSNANPISVLNFVEGAQFINANQVYIENPHAQQDGDKAAIILDTDGTLTGKAGQYVVVNNPFLANNNCAFKQAWNSYTCNNRYIFFSIESESGQSVAPLMIKRDDGVDGSLNGMDSVYAASSIMPSHTYTLQYKSGDVSRSIQLDFQHMNQGEWLGLVVPYTGNNFSVYRDAEHNKPITAAQSLNDFNASSGDKYYYDKAAHLIHLKAVPVNGNDWARINIEA